MRSSQLIVLFSVVVTLWACRSNDGRLVESIDTSIPPRQDIIDKHAAEDKVIDTIFKIKWVSLVSKAIYVTSARDHALVPVIKEAPAGDSGTFVVDLVENKSDVLEVEGETSNKHVTLYTFHVQYPSLRIKVLDMDSMRLVPLEKYEFK